jgi:hypothetical protein
LNANIDKPTPSRGLLRVKLRSHGNAMTRPVYLQQWTHLVTAGMAVECQNPTRAAPSIAKSSGIMFGKKQISQGATLTPSVLR